MITPDAQVGNIEEIATSTASEAQILITCNEFSGKVNCYKEQIDKPKPSEVVNITQTNRKPWMCYTAVTDTSSKQWELLQQAEADADGLLWIDGHLCVALGSKWGEVGTRYTFTMSGGRQLPIIKADEKQDAHTAGGEGWTGTDGHVMELIVDSNQLNSEAMYTGDCNCLIEGTVESYTEE